MQNPQRDWEFRAWRVLLWCSVFGIMGGISTMACGHHTAAEQKTAHQDGDASDHKHGHGHGDEGTHGHPGPKEMTHHHAHHRFDDVEKWEKRFEDPARDEWQKPEALLAWLNIDSAARIVDIGSATGYFPVRIARRMPQAQVIGIDIESTMVRYLNERAKSEKLPNLSSNLGTADDPMIPAPVDVVLMVNTYHHISARTDYFRKVAAHLNDGGRIAIVDFKPGDLPIGPPAKMKIPPDQVETEMSDAGCVVVDKNDSLLPHQFVRVFRCDG